MAPWHDSNYLVSVFPLTVVVHGWKYNIDYYTSDVSAWCAWYRHSVNAHNLSKFCERLQDCQFTDGLIYTKSAGARIANAPCLFRNGIGLYAIIAEKGKDPNLTLSSQREPAGLSFPCWKANV